MVGARWRILCFLWDQRHAGVVLSTGDTDALCLLSRCSLCVIAPPVRQLLRDSRRKRVEEQEKRGNASGMNTPPPTVWGIVEDQGDKKKGMQQTPHVCDLGTAVPGQASLSPPLILSASRPFGLREKETWKRVLMTCAAGPARHTPWCLVYPVLEKLEKNSSAIEHNWKGTGMWAREGENNSGEEGRDKEEMKKERKERKKGGG